MHELTEHPTLPTVSALSCDNNVKGAPKYVGVDNGLESQNSTNLLFSLLVQAQGRMVPLPTEGYRLNGEETQSSHN